MVSMMLLMACAPLAGQDASQAPAPAKPAEDYSGMYAFLKDGEFVQVTVEDEGRVTGFVSRYGGTESDRGAFLDHFFKQGKLDGKKLTFTTQTVHSVWYEFKGTVERGEGKNVGDEAYYVLKGTLTESSTDANKKTTSKSREVAFKSFPQDMGSPPGKQDSVRQSSIFLRQFSAAGGTYGILRASFPANQRDLLQSPRIRDTGCGVLSRLCFRSGGCNSEGRFVRQ